MGHTSEFEKSRRRTHCQAISLLFPTLPIGTLPEFMPLFELTLKKFLFPKDLPNDKANFRFIVDLRFINEKGQFITEHAVMPSLDTFWECDTGRKDRPNYVRGKDVSSNCSQFDMCAIDDWDKLILCVKGESVHSIQFKVIDVDRKDAWDKVKNFLEGMIGCCHRQDQRRHPGEFALSPS